MAFRVVDTKPRRAGVWRRNAGSTEPSEEVPALCLVAMLASFSLEHLAGVLLTTCHFGGMLSSHAIHGLVEWPF